MSAAPGVRTLMVWCPDWPVVAAEIVDGVPASGAVVVLHGNRVLACSEAARADGVRRGLRRREAQSRCPQLVVVEHDPGRDARAFEPVVAAVEEVAVGVEVIRAGACAVAARGPVRYFGGEESAAERIVEQIAQDCAVESQVGIADGVFAAGLAARAGQIVTAGGSREYLAGVPVEALDRPELTDLLRRLGVKTLGDFAALPASDVLSRFGFDGALAHRLAAGFDHRPLAVRRPPPDLDVSDTYDEPLERVDVAAFAGRVLAERLHERLAAHGLACTRLGIEAVTADGQELHRVWRHDGVLTAAAIAERVRWQLDGWLTGARRGAPARPTAGLVRLRLVPDGVLVHLGLQPGLWGDAGAERERAHRALSRVQGLLGPDAVLTPVAGGGRSADDRARLVPWGDERTPDRPAAGHTDPIPGMAGVAVQATADAPATILALVPDPASGPDPRAAHDRRDATPDAASGPALVAVPDSGSVPDLTLVPDPVPGPDLTLVPDSGSVPDLTLVPDPVPGPDLTVVPDSGSVPDLTLVPDPVPGPGLALVPDPPPRPDLVHEQVSDAARDCAPATSVSPACRSTERRGNVADPEDSRSCAIVPGNQGSIAQDRGPAPVFVAVSGDLGRDSPLCGRIQSKICSDATGKRDGIEADGGRGEDAEAGGTPGGKAPAKGARPKGRPAALPPWPGRLPTPSPALVLPQPLGAVVLDASGAPVGVSARLELTGSPATVIVGNGVPAEITGWAGPWPVDERWWDPAEARRRARFQVGLADGGALLMFLAGGHWSVEAIYD